MVNPNAMHAGTGHRAGLNCWRSRSDRCSYKPCRPRSLFPVLAMTILGLLYPAANLPAFAQQGSSPNRFKQTEDIRKILVGLNLRASVLTSGSGNQPAVIDGKSGERKPGGVMVQVTVLLFPTIQAAESNSADSVVVNYLCKDGRTWQDVKRVDRAEKGGIFDETPSYAGIFMSTLNGKTVRALGEARGYFLCGNAIAYVRYTKISGGLSLEDLRRQHADATDDALVQMLYPECISLTRDCHASCRTWLTDLSHSMDEAGVCKGDAAGEMELLDANPQFLHFTVYSGAGYPPAGYHLVRRGAAADGVSLLLIRAKFQARGSVTISLAGADPGELHNSNENPWRHPGHAAITAATAVVAGAKGVTEGNWAYALYRPPGEFGSQFRGQRLRTVEVKCSYRPAAGGPEQKLIKTIELVRTPVVLVHGTYDNPRDCWRTPLDFGSYHELLLNRLIAAGYLVTTLDWEKTSGRSDPSGFDANEKTVWQNPGGIRDAVTECRDGGHACTQADLVCHSQGGVIARVYARGFPIDQDYRGKGAAFLHPEHYLDPQKPHGCWYHRDDNFNQGDIHRLLTVSGTHFGSDVCTLLAAYVDLLPNRMVPLSPSEWIARKLLDKANSEQGITGAFWDQEPGSGRLRKIGPTSIPAHAIACLAEDEDLDTGGHGAYEARMEKIWKYSPRELLLKAFTHIGQPEDGRILAEMKDEEADPGKWKAIKGLPIKEQARMLQLLVRSHARRLREAAFGDAPNDCTVRQESSHGGLAYPYASSVQHVLHGFAPGYKSVQDRVIDLLDGVGEYKFNPNGFPAAGQKEENGKPRPFTPWDIRLGEPGAGQV